jgi:GTP-binding protein HflX
VWNKVDRVDAAERERLANAGERQPAARRPVLVSAMTGEGVDRLVECIASRLAQSRVVIELELDPIDGAGASWLYRNVEVLEKTMTDAGRLAMTVRVDPAQVALVRSKFEMAAKATPA